VFVSTVIPTIGRSTLGRAVESALSQGLAAGEQEVIVVNDSGSALAHAEWQRDPRVSVLNTQRRERGFARNVGAATARGDYLHFLDDDDWLMPGALGAVRAQVGRLAGDRAPIWIYGASQLVDRDDRPLIKLHHGLSGNCFAQIMAGEWVPLQSSLYETNAFFQLGGFDPLIPGAEDIDFVRRLALVADATEVPATIACIRMGTQGSSTDYDRSRLDIRGSREKVLDRAWALGRMLDSSATSYLRGRVVRIYWTSGLWNARQRRWLTSLSRLLHGLWAMLCSPRFLFTLSFWRAMATVFRNETFERGFAQAGLPVYRRSHGD